MREGFKEVRHWIVSRTPDRTKVRRAVLAQKPEVHAILHNYTSASSAYHPMVHFSFWTLHNSSYWPTPLLSCFAWVPLTLSTRDVTAEIAATHWVRQNKDRFYDSAFFLCAFSLLVFLKAWLHIHKALLGIGLLLHSFFCHRWTAKGTCRQYALQESIQKLQFTTDSKSNFFQWTIL